MLYLLLPGSISGRSGEGGSDQPSVTPLQNISFYLFRTRFDPDRSEIERLRLSNPAEISFRLFDIDLSGDGKLKEVVAPLRLGDQVKGFMQSSEAPSLSGVVFITNRSLVGVDPEKTAPLAGYIYKNVKIVAEQNSLVIANLQVDCDWTTTTKNSYFALLKQLDSLFSKEQISVSSTLRLHQIKFRETTGVPPVERGVVMFYNLDPPGKWETENSIYDPATVKKYLSRLEDYPLKLDIALPRYSQVVVFSGGRASGLLGGDLLYQLEGSGCYEKVGDNRYRARERTVLYGAGGGLREIAGGSFLRYETVKDSDLLELARKIFSIRKDIQTVYLYDYHQSFYRPEKINRVDRPPESCSVDSDAVFSDKFFNKEGYKTLVTLSRLFSAYSHSGAPVQ